LKIKVEIKQADPMKKQKADIEQRACWLWWRADFNEVIYAKVTEEVYHIPDKTNLCLTPMFMSWGTLPLKTSPSWMRAS
jgi:hypothetical protein